MFAMKYSKNDLNRHSVIKYLWGLVGFFVLFFLISQIASIIESIEKWQESEKSYIEIQYENRI